MVDDRTKSFSSFLGTQSAVLSSFLQAVEARKMEYDGPPTPKPKEEGNPA